MSILHFEPLNKENIDHKNQFISALKTYALELDDHLEKSTPPEIIEKWGNSIINKLGDSDRHLILCYINNNLIGFFLGKVDHENHPGYIKVGYGYIMEFFVYKQYRSNGYGKLMFKELERLFFNDGIKKMYLTADPITGVPFWKKMGFKNTNEISPENNLEFYEKTIEI